MGFSYTDIPDVAAVICGVIFGLLALCGVVTLVVILLFFYFKRKKFVHDMMFERFDTELKHTESSSRADGTDNKQNESGGVSPSAASSRDSHFTSSATLLHPSTTHTPSSAPSTDQPLSPLPRFKVLDVDNDCELKEFVEKKNLTFNRGCCFYQFTHDVEKIGDKQEIVLMNKVIFRILALYSEILVIEISWIHDSAQ